MKNKIDKSENTPLTMEEKAKLEKRYQNWRNAPSSAISLEDTKKQLLQKYGK